jgi:Na+/phosphate symporter
VLKGKEAALKKEKRREREKKKEKQKVVRRMKVLNAVVEQTLRTKKEQLVDELVEKRKQIKKLESGKEAK